jgi:hypothetical protein
MTASPGEVSNAARWLLGRNAAATPDRVAVTATGQVQRYRLREHAVALLSAGPQFAGAAAEPAVRQGEPA